MADTLDHPIWHLYNEIRTTRLNCKILEWRIRGLRMMNFGFEVTIAFAATSSIGGFWFFQTFVGGCLWKTIGAVAIVCTTLKPILKYPERIRKVQELLTGYKVLGHDLHCISLDANHRQKYDDECYKELKKSLKRKSELIQRTEDSTPSRKSILRFEAEVNQELPVDQFYVPPV